MLVLASRSPIRAKLLTQAGVHFVVASSPYDENQAHQQNKTLPALQLCSTLAQGKASALSVQRPHDVIIGCDQTLECQGNLIHKSSSIADARQTLTTLRGHTHYLHSAVAVAQHQNILFRHTSTVKMHMRPFSDEFLDTFISQSADSILESVGCYHYEGLGAQLFEHVDGDYHAILGLPLLPLLAFLREIGELKT